ncbi:SMI1/KNR4 family protein [Streptomyces sp. NPDC041068]|uniref:SMI1/KNR4 family protein n=1 Tax=Streptomyces sp. NPDC041068 TaxID=3155130 RepID=UPI00340D99DA
MTVEESWAKIERWIAQQAPEEDPLPAPCTREDLQRLYEHLGLWLPEDVERSLLRHDGSGLTEILPPGYTLLGVEEILRNRSIWLEYATPDDTNLDLEDKTFLVPIAELSVTKLMVDTRTGRLGSWDIEEGYFLSTDPLRTSLSVALAFVGNLLASSPPWIVPLPGGGELEVTDVDPDFPGTLVWTDGPID